MQDVNFVAWDLPYHKSTVGFYDTSGNPAISMSGISLILILHSRIVCREQEKRH